MYLRCLSCAWIAVFAVLPAAAGDRVLRVCADPNNMPFSNEKQEGFENRVAELIAQDVGAHLEYTWWSLRKGFVRNALNADVCDVVIGMPSESDMVLVTRPYYRSTYVFAYRHAADLHLTSLDDPRLAHMKIGMYLAGNDFGPPANIIAARRLMANVVPFRLYGPYGEPSPASKLLEAVARGDVDVAVAWGPFAGYFAEKSTVPLDVVPLSPHSGDSTPFAFNISVAVRKTDDGLRSELDAAVGRQCAAIQSLLKIYGIPQATEDDKQCAASR